MPNSGKNDDSDATIGDLLEKKNILDKEVKELKREQEIQSLWLWEVTEQKKKVEEEKSTTEEEKSQMTTKIEEILFEVQNNANN